MEEGKPKYKEEMIWQDCHLAPFRLLKEDRQRERAKSQSVAENASSNTAKLSSERDAALAEVSHPELEAAAKAWRAAGATH